jgi:DNA-binding NarL/FixJ family response regulator
MQLKADPKAANRTCATEPVMTAIALQASGRNKAAVVTSAENRVLALVTQAKTNKEIAHDLGISPATVKRHLENVLGKLGLRNRVEAAIYGILLNGCAGGVGSECALQTWRKEREMTVAIPTDGRDRDAL